MPPWPTVPWALPSLQPSRCAADAAVTPQSGAMPTPSSGRQPRLTARCSRACCSHGYLTLQQLARDPETDGALLARVLQPHALLGGERLPRRGRAHREDRCARPVDRCAECGCPHGSPRGRAPRVRRRCRGAGRGTGVPPAQRGDRTETLALLGPGEQLADRRTRQRGGDTWPRHGRSGECVLPIGRRTVLWPR
jgi:hypothetical protein